MKNNSLSFALSLVVIMSLSLMSCQAIGDIFKAGAWFGIIGIIIVVFIILWLVGKAKK